MKRLLQHAAHVGTFRVEFCILVRTPANTLFAPTVIPIQEATEEAEADTVGVPDGFVDVEEYVEPNLAVGFITDANINITRRRTVTGKDPRYARNQAMRRHDPAFAWCGLREKDSISGLTHRTDGLSDSLTKVRTTRRHYSSANDVSLARSLLRTVPHRIALGDSRTYASLLLTPRNT